MKTLTHAYCTGCEAQVTVVDGRCLLDHRIDPSSVSTSSGRRLRSRRNTRPDTASPSRPRPEPPPPNADRLDFFDLDLRTEEIQLPSVARVEHPQGTRPEEPEPQYEPARSGGSVALAERPERRALVPTNDIIAELWAGQSDSDTDIEGWVPGVIDTDVRVVARRVLISTLLVIAVAIIGAASWFLAGRGDASLAARLGDVADARAELAAVLDSSSTPITDLADGTIDDPDALSRTISEIDDASRVMFSAAAELPAEGGEAELRSPLIAISDQALELSRDMSRTGAYVSSVEVMLNRPAFPFAVEDADLTSVAEQTATWVTRFLSMSASLPDTPAMPAHREAMIAMADTLPEWQAEYLGALRSGDVDAAGAAIDRLEKEALALTDGLETDLSRAAEEFDSSQTAILTALDGA